MTRGQSGLIEMSKEVIVRGGARVPEGVVEILHYIYMVKNIFLRICYWL